MRGLRRREWREEAGGEEGECLEEGTHCSSLESSGEKGGIEKSNREILESLEWNGLSVYTHLRNMLELLVATRPRSVIDYFDQFSRSMREPRGVVKPSDRLPSAKRYIRLVQSLKANLLEEEEEEEMTEEGYFKSTKKVISCLDMSESFTSLGIALPKSQLHKIDVTLRALVKEDGIKEVRFWGKIFGLDRSYFVAETTLTYEEIQERQRLERELDVGEEMEEETLLEEPKFGFAGDRTRGLGLEEEEEAVLYKKLYSYRMPPLPRPKREKKKPMKPEVTGEGANSKIYYVWTEDEGSWNELPNVRPEEITAARKVRRLLRGHLNAEVNTFPPYPGLERHFLRAQIARISAGTHISPLGYFQFAAAAGGEGDNEPTDQAGEAEPYDIVVNIDYEEIPYQDLLKPDFWVHHKAHILRIGRTSYPPAEVKLSEEDEEEEEEPPAKSPATEEAVQGKPRTPKREEGPPLLTPISEDVTLEDVPPWRFKTASRLLRGSGPVGVFSNLWPGAVAVNRGRHWENIYIGNGSKLKESGYSPGRAPLPLTEHPLSLEIKEATDPSPQEEAEWRLAHRPPSPPPQLGEEEAEEGPLYPEPSDF